MLKRIATALTLMAVLLTPIAGSAQPAPHGNTQPRGPGVELVVAAAAAVLLVGVLAHRH